MKNELLLRKCAVMKNGALVLRWGSCQSKQQRRPKGIINAVFDQGSRGHPSQYGSVSQQQRQSQIQLSLSDPRLVAD